MRKEILLKFKEWK